MLASYQTPDERKTAGATSIVQQKLRQWECYSTLEKILNKENIFQTSMSPELLAHPVRLHLEQDLSLAIGLFDSTSALLQRSEKKALPQQTSSLYALFVGAYELSQHSGELGNLLSVEPEKLQQYVEKNISPGLKGSNIAALLSLGKQNSLQPYADFDRVIAGYVDFLHKERTQENTLNLHTYLYFSKLAKDICFNVKHSRKADTELDKYISAIEQQKLKIENRVYSGFSCLSLYERQQQDHEKILAERQAAAKKRNMQQDVVVIGNEEAVVEINGFINMVALYDPHMQRNIICGETAKPFGVMLTGSPGSGKSTMIKHAQKRLQCIAGQKGMEYHDVFLKNDFQNEYHGRDVKNLMEKIMQVEDPTKLSLFVLDDIDGIIQARNAKDSTHIEGKSLHTLMQWLDGVETFYNGNYLVIATTNYPDKVDIALKRRFTEQIVFEGIKTTEHYTALLKHELQVNKDYLPLTAVELTSLGEMLRKKGCTGSDVYYFSIAVNKRINNVQAIDERLYLKPYEEQQRLLPQYKRSLHFTDLKSMVQRYQPRNTM